MMWSYTCIYYLHYDYARYQGSFSSADFSAVDVFSRCSVVIPFRVESYKQFSNIFSTTTWYIILYSHKYVKLKGQLTNLITIICR